MDMIIMKHIEHTHTDHLLMAFIGNRANKRYAVLFSCMHGLPTLIMAISARDDHSNQIGLNTCFFELQLSTLYYLTKVGNVKVHSLRSDPLQSIVCYTLSSSIIERRTQNGHFIFCKCTCNDKS